MRSRLALVALSLVASSVLAAGCVVNVDADAYTSREEKTFAVGGVADLNLVTFDGAIEVRSWDRPDVVVTIEKRAMNKEEADTIEIRSEQSGNRISIEARRPSDSGAVMVIGHYVGRSVRLVATVPATTNILARSGDGTITIDRVNGRLELRTGDGNIKGTDLAGRVRAHTGDGNVSLENVDGTLDVDTGDGTVAIAGKLTGTLAARTGDGSVTIKAGAGSAMAGDWAIETGDGTVTIELPEPFDAQIDAHTGDGRVRVTDLPIAESGGVDKDTLKAQLGSGGHRLRIRTGDGSIRLRGRGTT